MTSRPGAGRGATTFHAAAEVYDRHVGRYSPGLAAGLVRFSGIFPGQRALDVGCGPGGLTAALAASLGGGSSVAAVDLSETFVEACRARVPGADVRLAGAEALPFEDGSFDRVLSQLTLNFVDDPPAAVREMRRTTRSGGVVAACVWDYAGEMRLLRAFWDAAVALEPELARPRDEGRCMPFCTPDELAGLWCDAGLTGVRTGELTAHAEYDGFDDLWAPFPTGLAPSGAYCVSLDRRRQDELRDEFRLRLGEPAGPFCLTARAWSVRGDVQSR